MKLIKCALPLIAFALLAGCKENPDSAAGSANDMDTTTQTRRDAAGAVNSTLRDATNAAATALDNTRKNADNTGRNVRDRNDASLTPMDQGESKADLEVTRNIRKAIVGKENLSMAASNIKIITANGRVTLRGPVNSQEEKDAIVSLARNVAGDASVDDQLEVKTTNQ